MRDEVFITVLAALVIFIWIGDLDPNPPDAEGVYTESGVKNLVTSVYLYQRMYDTVFEVLVFSLVVMGLSLKEIGGRDFRDDVFKPIAGIMAFFLGIASVYLALTGHVYPGGGFTAGVVGGTSLLLMGMARGIDRFEEELERFRVPAVEKALLSLIVALSIPILLLPTSKPISLMNFLIYFKVMAGTWIITYKFIKHRGIV